MPERYPRDMVGYGSRPPHPHWPGAARIALQIVLNYEEGAESCVLHGDTAATELDLMRQHLGEQARRQIHRPDHLQALQGARHAGHARPARVAAHEVQQRPGTCRRGRLVAAVPFGLCRRRLQQGIEPLGHLLRQPSMDGGV